MQSVFGQISILNFFHLQVCIVLNVLTWAIWESLANLLCH